jgi:hypothetical protein
MTTADYEELYRRLWRAVIEREGKISDGTEIFIQSFLAQLKNEGYQFGPGAEAELAAYLGGIDDWIRAGIGSAITTMAGARLADEALAKLTEAAFVRRWPDGLSLSQRLWRFSADTRQGLTGVLQAGARSGRAVNAVVYVLQRAIEAKGARFEIAHQELEDWTTLLAEAGKTLIKNPETRRSWDFTVSEVRRHLDKLSDQGTRHAAETAFQAIRKAVADGNAELIDGAVKWWMYDKQLFFLKRIARTEMADAGHNAVIDASLDDADVVGYWWRLSASHPRPDICDVHASVELGLGKGVFPKDSVPRHKAHPHCMCLLIPRVTRRRTQGSIGLAEFAAKLPEDKRKAFIPRWVDALLAQGVPINELLRPDGLWFVSRQEVVARMGEDRVRRAEALFQG